MALVALLALGSWAAWKVVPESAWWVALHSDVEWHRDWQNARLKQSRTYVLDLYEGLARAHPDSDVWAYLAVRALPGGAGQLEAFQSLRQRFPDSGWVRWGQSAALAQAGDSFAAMEATADALRLLGPEAPPSFLRSALSDFAEGEAWGRVEALYASHGEAIRTSGEGAAGMAYAEFMRGNMDGAVRWEALAEQLGSTTGGYRKLRLAYEALGLRPDVASTHSGYLELRVFAAIAEETDSGHTLKLGVRYVFNGNGYGRMGRDTFVLRLRSGRRLEATNWALGQNDFPVGQPWDRVLVFDVPRGEQVEALLFDSGALSFTERRRLVAPLFLSRRESSPTISGINPP